jgi:hypothetical protein
MPGVTIPVLSTQVTNALSTPNLQSHRSSGVIQDPTLASATLIPI